MKKIFFILTLAAASLSLSAQQSQFPAFPGAEGWGMYAKGGRGGKVIAVTNLNNDGPGSFRAAVMDTAPRIVVFNVSGTIKLTSELIITSPYLTIAGQTAPGDGICLRGYPLDIAKSHDIIVRCIRIRPGTESGLIGSEIDGVEIRGSENVIFDHCSVSWSCDEGINNWHQSRFITFQWCMMSEPLNKSVHEKGAHGFGASIGGYKASFHHNIIAHATARVPSIAGNNQNFTVLLDVRNCVFYNWGHRSCDGKPLSINLVNNYYKSGAATQSSVKRRIAKIDNSEKAGFVGLWHIDGNHVDGFAEITKDNWNGGVDFDEGTSAARNRQIKPFEVAAVTTQTALEAYPLVLCNAGCIAPYRDNHDTRIAKEIEEGKFTYGTNGIIDSPEQVGGWPALKSIPAPLDSDGDGIPDAWEKKNGLNPNDASDANKLHASGYTNLEVYVNGLVPMAY